MNTQYSVESVCIPIKDGIDLKIYSERDLDKATLLEIPEDNALKNVEERYQLLEGCSYEYSLPKEFSISIKENQGIVKPLRAEANHGRIVPNIYVGRLTLRILKNSEFYDEIAVEVRSCKTDYRSDYRKMLEDITAECADLLMIHSSPVTQRFAVNHDASSQTLYQRFAFVKSIVDSEDFRNAVHRIIDSPVTKWAHTHHEQDVRRARRITASHLRQISSGKNRINLPAEHPFYERLKSIPSRIMSSSKIDTVDTPENRFIKHALNEFQQFCIMVRRQLEKSNNTGFNIYIEVKELEERFSEYLNHSLFREVSTPQFLPLSSPVLQRKEGYREVLHVWLMFDLAAKLCWTALEDDSYHAGKRDVATLYEYWLFFKLLHIVQDIFALKPEETEKLIVKTRDGMGLQLRQGTPIELSGTYTHKGRMLKVRFHYNKTFGKSDYPHGGSWTKQMRPDYSLSLWPAAFTDKQAEEQEIIVHIHFDAKYRVEGLSYLLTDEETDLDSEKREQKEGTYKRADLLKMHAYKDAIRRTAGAYVLYPGDKPYKSSGFHEIVPGLGAFPVSPSNGEEGTEKLKQFILEIVEHFTNRASQREELSYRTYEVMSEIPCDDFIEETLPEQNNDYRTEPPTLTTVLIGYYKNEKHYEWVKKKGLYNIRIDKKLGLSRYSSAEIEAKYLLLHGLGGLITGDIWKISGISPEMMSKSELIKCDYPDPSQENYLVYTVEKIFYPEFENIRWDIRKLAKYVTGHGSAKPFAVTLQDLMKAKEFKAF